MPQLPTAFSRCFASMTATAVLLMVVLSATHPINTYAVEIIKPQRILEVENGDSQPPLLSIDLDPPSIDHESLVDGVSGEPQSFSVRVVDDEGVQSVMLHYRLVAGEYSTVSMRPMAGANDYLAVVETSTSDSLIEYFIEAIDTGGNRVLKGFPYRPLARPLTMAAAADSSAATTPSSTIGTRKNWVYLLFGVVAFGLLASVSDSGGGGPPPNDVTLTITAPLPGPGGRQ